MTALIAAVFAASLAGSLHCAGMCGGLITFTSGSGSSQAAYHGGRLLSYMLLGTVAGALGSAIDWAGASWASVPRAAAIAAGLVMVLWGSMSLAASAGWKMPRAHLPKPIGRLIYWAHGAIAEKPPALRGLILGVLTALLPCGWLYSFVVTASGTGAPLTGAAVMAFFWLGTVPLLAGIGEGVKRLSGPLRRHLPRLAAVLVVTVGLATIAGHFGARARAAEKESCHGQR